MINDDPVLILLKSVVATFINRSLEEANGKLPLVIEQSLQHVIMPAEIIGDGGEAEVAQALEHTLRWLEALPEDIKVFKEDLIERIRLNCKYAPEYLDSLESLLVLSEDNYENSERVKTIVSELQYDLREKEFAKLFKDANKKINFSADRISVKAFAAEMEEKLRSFSNALTEGEKEGFGGRLSTENPDSVMEVIDRAKMLRSKEGMLITGLKGLNRLLGGGYQRGEQFNYGGLTHQYKTGMLLNHCAWFCLHNKPNLRDKNKKPLVVRFSFENKLEQDTPTLYKSLWEQEYQQKLDKASIDVKETTNYIIEKLTRNGMNFEMLCYDPNNYDVWDLIDDLNSYEHKGYEIHAVIIDYPELITKKVGSKNPTRKDQVIAYTFEVIRNHCFPRDITQITAHQLSTEAQKMAREGTAGFAKKVASGSYYMECQSLATKLDGECIIHKHKIGDDEYLTMARGKHRGGEDTPIKHRACAYKFEMYGGICDDLHVEGDEGNAIYSFAGLDAAAGEIDDPSTPIDDDDW